VMEYWSVGVMGVASYDTTPSLRYSITPTADFSPWNNFRKQPMKISVKRQAKLVLRYISDLGETAHDWPYVGGMIRGVEISGFWQRK